MTTMSFLRLARGTAALAVMLVSCGGDDDPASAPTTPATSEDGGIASPDAGRPPEELPDCGASGGPTGYLADQQMTVKGVARRYHLFVPEGHDGKKTYPLVFVFHGNGGSGSGMRRALDLEGASSGEGIFVYPDGFGGWDLDTKADDNDDVAFVEQMLSSIGEAYCVDKSRVFATGYSNGGYFSNQLACRRGSLFRGIASHAGGGPYGGAGDYDANGDLICPDGPVAALIAHGTADGAVALGEGEKTRNHWRKLNGCQGSTSPYPPSPCVAYDGCADGKPVVFCQVEGLGHQVWPAEGANVTWKFFSEL
jgi:polyhydroxybutyrate depolymerase